MKTRYTLLICLLLIGTAGTFQPLKMTRTDETGVVQAQNQNQDPVIANGTYNLYIEMEQWNMTIYDLNYVDDLVDTGMNESEAMDQARYRGSMGSFEKGMTMKLTLVSLDVQHGFSINEVDVAVALNRPQSNETAGAPIIIDFDLPDEDMVMTAFCHIFCGLGHNYDSHKFDFIVGNPRNDQSPLDSTSFSIIVVGLLSLSLVLRRLSLSYAKI